MMLEQLKTIQKCSLLVEKDSERTYCPSNVMNECLNAWVVSHTAQAIRLHKCVDGTRCLEGVAVLLQPSVPVPRAERSPLVLVLVLVQEVAVRDFVPNSKGTKGVSKCLDVLRACTCYLTK